MLPLTKKHSEWLNQRPGEGATGKDLSEQGGGGENVIPICRQCKSYWLRKMMSSVWEPHCRKTRWPIMSMQTACPSFEKRND